MEKSLHQPVMAAEALEALRVRAGGTYVDATLGGGGHAIRIAEAVGPTGWLIALDRDPEAVRRAEWLKKEASARVTICHSNFSRLRNVLDELGVLEVDGVLFDLGVSSDQLMHSHRGFSFQQDGPLDMRMDPTEGVTAADLLNCLEERELAELIWRYGEERRAKRLASALVARRRQRPWARTLELAELALRVVAGGGRLHPATRLFQALRIAVNDELGALEEGLEVAIERVRVGGRVVAIAFHSLEDRVVKQVFWRHFPRWENLQGGGRRRKGERPYAVPVHPKPLKPTLDEVERNPCARSARLRAVERVEEEWPCAA